MITTSVKERPLSLIPSLARAVVEGRKTVTRRLVKPAKDVLLLGKRGECGVMWDACPYGMPGDRFWLRERARVIEVSDGTDYAFNPWGDNDLKVRLRYEADGVESDWLPYPIRLAATYVGKCIANGVYREASRWLGEIDDVRAEHVQDISHEDAVNEGVEDWAGDRELPLRKQRLSLHQIAFSHLWDSVSKKGTNWNANPFVWVIQFHRITADT